MLVQLSESMCKAAARWSPAVKSREMLYGNRSAAMRQLCEFQGYSFFVSQHSSRCFRTTTMADICHISVNTGQICMEFEADTMEM